MWADLIADDLRPEFAGPSPYAQKQAITPNIVRSSSASSLPCSLRPSDDALLLPLPHRTSSRRPPAP